MLTQEIRSARSDVSDMAVVFVYVVRGALINTMMRTAL